MSEAVADARRRLETLSVRDPVPAGGAALHSTVSQQLSAIRSKLAERASACIEAFDAQDAVLKSPDQHQLRETLAVQLTRVANELQTLESLIDKIAESGEALVEEDIQHLGAVVDVALDNGGIDYGGVVQLRASIAVRSSDMRSNVGEFISEAARDVTVRLNYISQNVYPQLVQREDRTGLIDQAMRNQILSEEKTLSDTMSKIMQIFHNGNACDDTTIQQAFILLHQRRDVHAAVNEVIATLPPTASI